MNNNNLNFAQNYYKFFNFPMNNFINNNTKNMLDNDSTRDLILKCKKEDDN